MRLSQQLCNLGHRDLIQNRPYLSAFELKQISNKSLRFLLKMIYQITLRPTINLDSANLCASPIIDIWLKIRQHRRHKIKTKQLDHCPKRHFRTAFAAISCLEH